MKRLICVLLTIILVLSISFSNAESAASIQIKSIKLEKTSISLLLGASDDAAKDQIKFSVTPENATATAFSYSSSNDAVVTVDSEGNLQAVGIGKAKITISPNEEKPKAKAICNVTVGQAVTKISIPSSQTISKKKTLSLKPTIEPKEASSKKVIFSSSNENVATVTNAGLVKGVNCGSATITCTAADGSGVATKCEITVIQPVTKVSSDKKKIVLFKGKTSRWAASATPADATIKKLSYTSDNSRVASIDSNGNITAKNKGTTTITAKATDGSNKACVCTVVVEPSVPISLDSLGFGIFNFNLLGITVSNRCSEHTIVDFDFDLAFYSYNGTLVNSGSYSLGSKVKVRPGRQKTIKRTVYGVGQAYKTVMTITGVLFSDGTYWSIPSSEQETWSFTR